ncbi:hypothetical protein MRX96_003769 [Rhipicephalus microplus]
MGDAPPRRSDAVVRKLEEAARAALSRALRHCSRYAAAAGYFLVATSLFADARETRLPRRTARREGKRVRRLSVFGRTRVLAPGPRPGGQRDESYRPHRVRQLPCFACVCMSVADQNFPARSLFPVRVPAVVVLYSMTCYRRRDGP